MAVYRIAKDSLYLYEIPMYGSNRLGVIKEKMYLTKKHTQNSTSITSLPVLSIPQLTAFTGKQTVYSFGKKHYESVDWLGNVRVTYTDKKSWNNGNFALNVSSSLDYYPFGSVMEGRKYNLTAYRYAFNTQERVPELNESHYTALYWEYDGRLARRWNVDPEMKEHESVYAAFANNPVWFSDLLGADSALAAGSKTWMWEVEKGDTYWSISKRTGVSIENLRAWNKYEDTKIPTGALLFLSDPSKKNSSNPKVKLPSGYLEILDFMPSQLLGEGFIQPWLEIEGKTDISVDELEWLQTFETNDPIKSEEQAMQKSRPLNPGFYIDASKEQNNYPFYFDKSPNAGGNFGFFDIPRRTPNQQGTVYWKGYLSLMRKTDVGYVVLVTFSWGFEVQKNGSSVTYLLRQTDTPSDFHKQVIKSIK